MAQIDEGIRSILSIPAFYSFFQKVLGAHNCGKTFIESYVKPREGDRILDIGCGPADVLAYLPQVEYIGFDASKRYIDTAKRRYGDRGTFICDLVTSSNLQYQSYFDIVLVMGILHHLDNREAAHLFELAYTALKPGGRLVAIENCYTESQSACARYIISKDRGQNIRDEKGYMELANVVFKNSSFSVRHDLLRIPYTHIILECVKGQGLEIEQKGVYES